MFSLLQRPCMFTLLVNLWLRCLGKKEVQQVLKEARLGVCGAHKLGPRW